MNFYKALMDVMGEIKDDPDAYTLLKRLKDVVTAIVAGGVGAYTTPTHTQPEIGSSTTAALAANAARLYALLANESGETIYLKLGADAVQDRGIPIRDGGNYEMSRELGNLYVGAINGICASGGKILLVTEGV